MSQPGANSIQGNPSNPTNSSQQQFVTHIPQAQANNSSGPVRYMPSQGPGGSGGPQQTVQYALAPNMGERRLGVNRSVVTQIIKTGFEFNLPFCSDNDFDQKLSQPTNGEPLFWTANRGQFRKFKTYVEAKTSEPGERYWPRLHAGRWRHRSPSQTVRRLYWQRGFGVLRTREASPFPNTGCADGVGNQNGGKNAWNNRELNVVFLFSTPVLGRQALSESTVGPADSRLPGWRFKT